MARIFPDKPSRLEQVAILDSCSATPVISVGMRKIWGPVSVLQEAMDAKSGSRKNRVRIGLSQLCMKQAQSSSPGMEGAGLGKKMQVHCEDGQRGRCGNNSL